MDWTQILFLFLGNASLIIWFRAESRADWRHMDNKLDTFRKETHEILNAIKEEMKDFHTRLLKIEESRKDR